MPIPCAFVRMLPTIRSLRGPYAFLDPQSTVSELGCSGPVTNVHALHPVTLSVRGQALPIATASTIALISKKVG